MQPLLCSCHRTIQQDRIRIGFTDMQPDTHPKQHFATVDQAFPTNATVSMTVTTTANIPMRLTVTTRGAAALAKPTSYGVPGAAQMILTHNRSVDCEHAPFREALNHNILSLRRHVP
uniref:Uncharacterized protein n=1 Tax=Eutreptiella gymnastica TaxID=73025 RepID=A0A7S4CLV8_9EUGL|mmetsp:Transcript_67786/g.113833  ORF Transcript_67786/g.113833 Transcript_67786/m.113833 type:complete len:117 (+) Transcript_67786:297-647(+)